MQELIANEKPVTICGIVYQEVLQGIRDKKQYDFVKRYLKDFDFLQTDIRVYELAADIFSKCKSKGTTATTVDCLIAALAVFHECPLLTTDKDFLHMQKHCDLSVYPLL